jgi:hypothetical protein
VIIVLEKRGFEDLEKLMEDSDFFNTGIKSIDLLDTHTATCSVEPSPALLGSDHAWVNIGGVSSCGV